MLRPHKTPARRRRYEMLRLSGYRVSQGLGPGNQTLLEAKYLVQALNRSEYFAVQST